MAPLNLAALSHYNLPVAVAIWSSAISPSGVVNSRSVKPLPGPVVVVCTRIRAK